LVFYSTENTERVRECDYDLSVDGICMLYDPEYNAIVSLPSTKFRQDILRELPEGYVFLDYLYQIKNGTLSTFHRDVTSSSYIHNTKYPVYTAILYKYDGALFSFCPGSHRTYPFVWSRITNIHGYRGTVFLFDSELLHAGAMNESSERELVQYKICHIEDIPKLESLSGVRASNMVSVDSDSAISFWGKTMRKISYFLEMPIHCFLYPLMMKRENSDNIIGKIQSWIPISFYNNG